MKRQILLTGSSGKLGQAIVKSNKFNNILTPSSLVLDICDKEKIARYFSENKVDVVIHAAAMARLVNSEVNPAEAIEKNIIGTSNLVLQVLKENPETNTRFIYISSDGVYAGTQGNYKETDPTIPRTRYGWSKLAGECAVNMLKNHCIIRTRFFDPKNIPFDTSANDLFTSKLPIDQLVDHIYAMMDSGYIGTVNIGGERTSDFECHSKYKSTITACSRTDIAGDVTFELPSDISMNISQLKKLQITHTLK